MTSKRNGVTGASKISFRWQGFAVVLAGLIFFLVFTVSSPAQPANVPEDFEVVFTSSPALVGLLYDSICIGKTGVLQTFDRIVL